MIRCQRMIALPLAALVLAVSALPAAAEAEFYAPASVRAGGDGSFSFEAHLVAGADCVGWTGYGYFGEENVVGGEWADTFCIEPQPVAPGTVMTIAVSGKLTDPASSGLVYVTSGFCSGGYGEAQTLIQPPTVPTAPPTWGGLKARYR